MEEQPCQFSLARLLASIGVLCVAAALFAASVFPGKDARLECFIASTIFCSAGVGTLIGRALAFALVPTVIWMVLAAFAYIVFFFFNI